MSSPPLPLGLENTPVARVANRLHSIAIHLLRRARTVDRETGLSAERLSLLSVLAFAGPKTASELARTEMVSRPAITRILKSLEELGLVKREIDKKDRRHVLIRSTGKGRRVMEAGRRRRVARIAVELSSLDAAELGLVDEATKALGTLEL